MKRLLPLLAAALLLAACSSHSGADKEQLRQAHEDAAQMLHNVHADSIK